jgi:site-specific DNA-methyltransferase (adenine-specific)
MKSNKFIDTSYTPDVLSCLADLSNDEVFTPPNVAKAMIDLLPEELFTNPNTTFLDPACKSGIFLREIAKKLLVGLEDKIPNLSERIDHVFHKQLFGIAITELTSLMSRRTLYCSKYPNGKYSVSMFDSIQGNIKYRRCEHTFVNGKCVFCGCSDKKFGANIRNELESHAYEFIHTTKPEEIFNMKFDVIIGNPPYQLSTGGGQAQAIPLYDKFINQSIKLNPRYLVMIVPARWYSGGFPAIKDLRENLTSTNKISTIHDFQDASECFPDVEIKGGVCFFLWERDYKGKCRFVNHSGGKIISSELRPLLEPHCDTVIRNNEAISVLKKVQSFKEESFSSIVGTLWPFTVKSSFDSFHNSKKNVDDIFAFVMKNKGYISSSEINKNINLVGKYKLFLPRSVGSANSKTDVLKPIIGEPGTCCSGTYIICGPFNDLQTCENVLSYIQTKFFHFFLSLKKITQDTVKGCYELIPIQDFSHKWDDEMLCKKYNLSKDEIDYIDNSVWPSKPMKWRDKQ